MLEGILSEEASKVDRRASKDKEGIKYIVNLVEKNYDRLVEISELTDERKLFEFTKKVLIDVEKLCEPIGVTTINTEKPEEIKDPRILLGWAKLYQFMSSNTYFLSVTGPGKDIVNGYRKATGCESVEEQRERVLGLIKHNS